MACGTPVIAWNYGGASESVLDEKTGILFKDQTKYSIKSAIKKFEQSSDKYDPKLIREHSIKFSRRKFEENIKNFVNQKAIEFFNPVQTAAEGKR